MSIIAKQLKNKEVKIYPSDTYKKRGIIVDADETGVLFKITYSQNNDYTVGKLYFIGFGSKLSFEEC